ncbi:MAG: ATP-binding protein [Clostridiales bacterium]|jgi:AAA+ ATPase superfamily predicted ATPase|nr:ATP-binding protein [Clostridiales bacterium]
MFLCREKELSLLNELYQKKGFQFVVMYGRRRVGKTTLLAEFVKGKPGIFFVSQEYDHATALNIFSEKIHEHFGQTGLSAFENWNAAFEFIAVRAMNERIVLVLDEFPYLVGANKSIPSVLQNLIDHQMLNSQLFLVVCGSSMSFMEKGLLSAKSPLYGRLTSQMRIEPFGFFDSCRFVPNYSMEDKVTAYGITGGIPQYLQKFSDTRSIRENVLEEILKRSAYLYEEPRNLLKQELREPMVYNAIIEAIANGASRLNDIVTKTGMQSDKCAKYIRSLIELQILTRETPVGVVGGRKSIYKITDHYFKFWYRFVFDNVELVEQDDGETLYDRFIEKKLSEFIGRNVFENICIEYLRRLNRARKLPFVFTKIGRWWGADPVQKTQVEIDILAFHDECAVLCECKWRNEPLDAAEMTKLFAKAELFSKFTKKTFMFFSKSGFTQSAKKEATRIGGGSGGSGGGNGDRGGSVILVDLKKLVDGVEVIL